MLYIHTLLGGRSVISLAYFSSGSCFLTIGLSYEFFVHFRRTCFIRYAFCKYFLPAYVLLFPFLRGVSENAKVLNLDGVSFIIFFFNL